MNEVKGILRTRHYKVGYIGQETLIYGNQYGCEDFTVKSAHTLSGNYIGEPKWAWQLFHKWGVKPEKAAPFHNVCSIGFSERDQKWYGWSHRAIFGFGIGDVAKEGDSCTTSGFIDEYRDAHPELDKRVPVGFKAKTLEDARRMAIAFAESVS